MKHGWKIKKLGEVCEINYGTRVVQKIDGGTKFPVYGGGGATFKIDRFNREDCLIVARFAMSSQCVRFVKGKFFLNDSGLTIKSNDSALSQAYLDKHIIALNDKIYSLGKGAAQKNLDIKALKSLNIYYPINIPEQERIVSELDCINGILEKKREQIKELEALAQSIFYDMFGDPIQNEKGWEVKKFADCYKLRSGNGLSAKDIVIGKFPVYGGNGIVGYHNEFNLDGENIIIGRVGALCGNVRCVKGQLFVTDNAFILSKSVENNNVFLQYLLTIHNLRSYAREAMQPVISNTSLKNIDIILPPLSLQQAFAAKIEAIEKQKELVKRSIAETETLLASRMQHYFNEE